MTLFESVGLIATVCTVALALGGGIVVFRSAAVRASYNTLREHVDDLQGRVTYLEQENSRLRGEMRRMTKEFAGELSKELSPALASDLAKGLAKEVAPALISEMERLGAFNGR